VQYLAGRGVEGRGRDGKLARAEVASVPKDRVDIIVAVFGRRRDFAIVVKLKGQAFNRAPGLESALDLGEFIAGAGDRVGGSSRTNFVENAAIGDIRAACGIRVPANFDAKSAIGNIGTTDRGVS